MKKTYFWAYMWTIVLVLIFASALLVKCGAQTNTVSNSASERDSMIMCVSEFDKIFSLDDTVLETDEGCEIVDAFESYIHKDTVDIETARVLYRDMAKEIEFVIHLQLDEDDDSDASLFDGRWHEFNERYINKEY